MCILKTWQIWSRFWVFTTYEKFHDFNIIKGFCELHGSAGHVKPNVRLGVEEKKMSTNHLGESLSHFLIEDVVALWIQILMKMKQNHCSIVSIKIQ